MAFNETFEKSCLSDVTKAFIEQAQFAQITTEEAYTACSRVLEDSSSNSGSKVQYLLQCFVDNKVLLQKSKNIYLINDQKHQGVIVRMTRCYSPVCSTISTTPGQSCYSAICPNRLFSNFYLKEHRASFVDKDDKKEWLSRLPRYLLEQLNAKELKRQLAIEELRNFEEHFIKQLTVIRDIYAKPLLASATIIEEPRRCLFHDILFGNYHSLARQHKRILKALDSPDCLLDNALYTSSSVIFRMLISHFSGLADHYIYYVMNYVVAKRIYRTEINNNAAFARFTQQQEASEREIRLSLISLLSSPILRLPKYSLLLATIIKHTERDEQESLHHIMSTLNDTLDKVNEAARKAETEQRLAEIRKGLKIRSFKQQYTGRFEPYVLPDNVELVYEGALDMYRFSPLPTVPCHLFLFKHVLLITRKKCMMHSEEYHIIDKPIPVHMLSAQSVPCSTHFRRRQHATSFLYTLRRQLGALEYLPGNGYSDQTAYRDTLFRADDELECAVGCQTDSDISSAKSEAIHTVTGLKIRYRIRSLKERLRNRNTVDILQSFNSQSEMHLRDSRQEIKRSASAFLARPQTVLQKSASYPFRARSARMTRSRLLQIHHTLDSKRTYYFHCQTIHMLTTWKRQIETVLPQQQDEPFIVEQICGIIPDFTSIHMYKGTYTSSCGTVWCSLPIITAGGHNIIAIGTRQGFWVACTGTASTSPFVRILPYDCRQIEMYNNDLLVLRIYKPKKVLVTCSIDEICSALHMSSAGTSTVAPTIPVILENTYHQLYLSNVHDCMLRRIQIISRPSIIAFTVGLFRGEQMLCYLRRRRTGSVRLGFIVHDKSCAQASLQATTSRLRLFKEYKISLIQPIDLKIMNDHVCIRSVSEGIEKVDIWSLVMKTSSLQKGTSTMRFSRAKYSDRIELPAIQHMFKNNSYRSDDPALLTIGYVQSIHPGVGMICSALTASPIIDPGVELQQQEINFEIPASSVTVFYPYLLSFSKSAIEIRNLKTAALVQVIEGDRIRCLYCSQTNSQAEFGEGPIIHVSMFDVTKKWNIIYRLYLKEKREHSDSLYSYEKNE